MARIHDVRSPTPAWAGLLAVICASCGGQVPERERSGERELGPRYGISATLPSGWEGSLGREVLTANGKGADVDLYEVARENRSPPTDIGTYRQLRGDLRFEVANFASWDGITEDSRTSGHGFARRTFQLSGRLFVVFVESSSCPPAPGTLRQLNELLGSLEVAPGDFYPGLVEPARFPTRPGWHAGTSGVDEVDADGELATAWASTVPYRDEWNAAPSRTLERLPEDGIVIWVWLTRTGRFPPSGPDFDPAAGLGAFERHESWPGQVRSDVALYRFTGAHEDKGVEVHLFFGRTDPTQAMRAEAEAMLAGLELPDWGPWELEP